MWSGPSALRKIPGYRDHALKGDWRGARSSYLKKRWRVLYVVQRDVLQVLALEVNPHEYRHGKEVREVLRQGGFTKSKLRVRLTPGEVVGTLREKNELTQSELAARAKLTQATISSIETGRVLLDVERAKALARALRVHPARLLFPGRDVDAQGAA